MIIDDKVSDFFKHKVKQLFLYITNHCQLNCAHCLYKNNLKKNHEMSYDDIVNFLRIFNNWGAYKLTLLGGEPTLYDNRNKNRRLFKLIDEAKDMGFSYIRIDTNGQFERSLLDNDSFMQLDEITFSLDGYSADINDYVRGKGVFDKCIRNIGQAVDRGYNVQITSCIHKHALEVDPHNYVDNMIEFVSDLGVNTINLHPVVKVGVPRDNWIEDADITPIQWLNIYQHISNNIDSKRYRINVRAPERFVLKDQLLKNRNYYDYCPVRLGERALIDCDGMIRVCAFWIGSNVGVAKHTSNHIAWFEQNNELALIDRCMNGVCASQTRHFGNLVPLCMSFKPYQNEIVWNQLRNDRQLAEAAK